MSDPEVQPMTFKLQLHTTDTAGESGMQRSCVMLQVIGIVDGGVATAILNRCMHAGTSPSCVIRSCTACPMQVALHMRKVKLLLSLRRPQALNSLNANMVRPIHRSAGHWVQQERANRGILQGCA